MNTAALTCSLVLLVGLVTSQAQSQDPLDFYRSYLATFAKADRLDKILPFYTKELRAGLTKMPAEQQSNYMKMQVGKRGLTGLTVTNRSVDAKRAVLHMTAKTADGAAVSGSVTLVKEGNEWKLDDEAWALPPPK